MARKFSRLYVKALIEPHTSLSLNRDQAHYLRTVMRLKIGDGLKVFSDASGEWHATLTHLSRKEGKILAHTKLQEPEVEPRFLGLAFSPLRSQRLAFLIEKATELGVTHFYPLIMSRTQQRMPPQDRLERLGIEASEQSERLTVPSFQALQPLSDFWDTLQDDVTPLLCDERGQAPLLTSASARDFPNPLVIVGPEGGFSQEDFHFFEKQPRLVLVRLGRYILRSETAALSALSHFHCLF